MNGLFKHRPVKPQVDVHDGRPPQPAEPGEVRVAHGLAGKEPSQVEGRDRRDDRVALQDLAGRKPHAAHGAAVREDRVDPRAEAHRSAPRGKVGDDRRKDAGQGPREEAKVCAVGPRERVTEDLGREVEPRRVRVGVQRGDGDRIPQPLDRRARLASPLEPVAERLLLTRSSQEKPGRRPRGPPPLPDMEQVVAKEAREKVERPGKGTRAEDRPTRSAPHRNTEPRLERDALLNSKLREKRHDLRAAAQEDVLAGVYLLPASLKRERRRPPSQASRPLEQEDADPSLGERGGSARPRGSAADDDRLSHRKVARR